MVRAWGPSLLPAQLVLLVGEGEENFKGPRAGQVKDRQLLKFRKGMRKPEQWWEGAGAAGAGATIPSPHGHSGDTLEATGSLLWKRGPLSGRMRSQCHTSHMRPQLTRPASPGELRPLWVSASCLPRKPRGGGRGPSPCSPQLPSTRRLLSPSRPLCRRAARPGTGCGQGYGSSPWGSKPSRGPDHCPTAGADVGCSGIEAVYQKPREKVVAALSV